MSIWGLLFSCIILLGQRAVCSDSQQDLSSVNEKSSKQLPVTMDMYEYHHPPLPESSQKKGSRKEKSIDINEQNPAPRSRTPSRGVKTRARPKASTPSLEIPVQVIYDAEPTTVSTAIRSPGKSTISPIDRTTRTVVRRRQSQSNTKKKIDIRQTTSETNTAKVTESPQTFTSEGKSDYSQSTTFPKRSRGSYFEKRTGTPAPRVKIVEEKNFVFAHSGDFHYSFLGGDGTKVSSQGSLKSFDNNKTGEAVSGSVFYKDKDGNDYNLSYTADENGYRPVGAHLPTPPPIPPAIARALKYIADMSTPLPLDSKE